MWRPEFPASSLFPGHKVHPVEENSGLNYEVNLIEIAQNQELKGRICLHFTLVIRLFFFDPYSPPLFILSLFYRL